MSLGSGARLGPYEIPAPAEPDRYQLTFDLVSEGIDVFEACGSETTLKSLRVWQAGSKQADTPTSASFGATMHAIRRPRHRTR